MVKKVSKAKLQNKNCYFEESETLPDYKNVLVLKRFLTDRQKVMHHNYSGVREKNQRKLSSEIKKARYMALLPYTDQHML